MRPPDILDVAAKYGIVLQQRGEEWVGLCPFHGDRNPSFSVNPDKEGGVWNCFPCGFGGDVYALLSRLEGKPRSFYTQQQKKVIELEDLKEELLSLGHKKDDRKAVKRALRLVMRELSRMFRTADVELEGTLQDGGRWETFAEVMAKQAHLGYIFDEAWDELGQLERRWRKGDVVDPIPAAHTLLSQCRDDIKEIAGVTVAPRVEVET